MVETFDLSAPLLARLRLLAEALTRLDEQARTDALLASVTTCPACGTPAHLGHTLDCLAVRR